MVEATGIEEGRPCGSSVETQSHGTKVPSTSRELVPKNTEPTNEKDSLGDATTVGSFTQARDAAQQEDEEERADSTWKK